MFNIKINDTYYTLDMFSASNADKVFETFGPIRGEDIPHPYLYVINKKTNKIEQYKDIVISEGDKKILCKETRKNMEKDDSIITLFSFTFRIASKREGEYGRWVDIHDLIPYIYTKYDDKYLVLHTYYMTPFDETPLDNIDIIEPIGTGSARYNFPIFIVERNGKKEFYMHKHSYTWFPAIGKMYETSEHIDNIVYTRSSGSSNARWLLTKHQIIIYNGNDTKILTIGDCIDHNGNNGLVRETELKNSKVSILDPYGEYLFVIPNEGQRFVYRVDASGYHKTKPRNGDGDAKEYAVMPKNIIDMNCLRSRVTDVDTSYFCDADTDQIYLLRTQYSKQYPLLLYKVNLVAKPGSKNVEPWKIMEKRGDTWYIKYRCVVPEEREAHTPEEQAVILSKKIIGLISDKGNLMDINKLYANIPEYITVPSYKKDGDKYIKYPTFNLWKKFNTSPIEYANVDYDAVTIDVLGTNIGSILRGEVPFYDMKLWWHRSDYR